MAREAPRTNPVKFQLEFLNSDIRPEERTIPYADSSGRGAILGHLRRHFLDSPTAGSLFLPNPLFRDEMGLLELLDARLRDVRLAARRRALDLLPDCVKLGFPGLVLGESGLAELTPGEPCETMVRDPGTEWEATVKLVRRRRRACDWILVFPLFEDEGRAWSIQTAYPGEPAVMLPSPRFRRRVDDGELSEEAFRFALDYWERHAFCTLPSPERDSP